MLDPGHDSPAGAVADDHIAADYLDEAALTELGRRCRAATTEFENVPAAALEFLAQHCSVSPDAASVAIAQDRIAEKRFITACGIDVAPHVVIELEDDLRAANAHLFPALLKSARMGYDGKGQVPVDTLDALRAAWRAMGSVPCVWKELALGLKFRLSRAARLTAQRSHFRFQRTSTVANTCDVDCPARVNDGIARGRATLR